MQRSFVKAGIFAVLVLMLSMVGKAQLSQQYRAEIPFDFHVKNESFKAGSYSVGPIGTNSSLGPTALVDRKKGKSLLLGFTQLGSSSQNETGKLIFVKIGNQYILTRVVTPTFEIKMTPRKWGARLARSANNETNTVAVNLGR